ncbi:MAG: hypothetical protein EP347_07645 [Alphaproteobacteria bacterium]|nr:MAG: hypothetical protein EP347_07645 [Alphaproteobacteria bacterium]
MVIFRLVALILIVVALMLIGIDINNILGMGGEVSMGSFQSIESAWGTVHSGSLETAGANVPGAILGLPASLTIGGLGLILAFLFRDRG